MGDADAWRVGEVIDGLYRVDGIAGRGGMGLVYRVHHLGWGVDLAVKSPRPELFADDTARQRFLAEAQTWVSLGFHPHICSCHYVRLLGGVPRVFAEYVTGGSLREWIDDRRLYRGDRTEVLARLLDIAIQVGWGLTGAHARNIVHRDVKPGNVLLDPDGTARLTDFGLAGAWAAVDAVPPAAPGVSLLATVGGMTRAYASPEQMSRHPVGQGSDIFSFAVTVLELFTGGVTWLAGPAARAALVHHARQGPATDDLPPMPITLARILRDCLRNDPAARPAGMAEVVRSITDIYERVVGVRHRRRGPSHRDARADELNNRGVSLLDLGQDDQAQEAFAAALTLDPQHVYTIYNQGLRPWRRGDLTDVQLIGLLENARARSTDPVARVYPLALVHLERGDLASAVPLLEQAAAAAPDHPEIAEVRRLATERQSEAGLDGRVFEPVDPATSAALPVLAVAFSADGRRVLGASVSGQIVVWDAAGGQTLATMSTHAGKERSIDSALVHASFSADGGLALLGTYHEEIAVYDTGTASKVTRLKPARPEPPDGILGRNYLISSHFSPDASLVLTSNSRAACAELWDTRTGERVTAVDDLKTRSDEQRADAARREIRPRPWLLRLLRARKDALPRVAGAPPGPERKPLDVRFVCFDPEGRRGLLADRSDVWLWDITTGDLRPLVNNRGRSSTGREARPQPAAERSAMDARAAGLLRGASQATQQRLYAVAVATLTEVRQIPGHERAPATLRAWRQAAAGCVRTGIAGVWRVPVAAEYGEVITVRPGDAGDDQAFSRLPAAWTLGNGMLRRSTLSGGRETRFPLPDDHHYSGVFCVNDDGLALLVTRIHEGEEGEDLADGLELWQFPDAPPGRMLQRLATPPGLHQIRSVCLSAGGRQALSGGLDGTVHLWDLATGEHLRALRGHEKSVGEVCLSDDGRYALTGAENVLLWDLARGEQCSVVEHHRSSFFQAACFSPNGRDFAVARGKTTQVRPLDAPPGGPDRRVELNGNADRVTAVSFSPDGRFLLTGDTGGTVRLWDVHTGNNLHTTSVTWGYIDTVRFSPDGMYALAVAGFTTSVWHLDWTLEAHPSET